jgi:hypothetical protein
MTTLTAAQRATQVNNPTGSQLTPLPPAMTTRQQEAHSSTRLRPPCPRRLAAAEGAAHPHPPLLADDDLGRQLRDVVIRMLRQENA